MQTFNTISNLDRLMTWWIMKRAFGNDTCRLPRIATVHCLRTRYASSDCSQAILRPRLPCIHTQKKRDSTVLIMLLYHPVITHPNPSEQHSRRYHKCLQQKHGNLRGIRRVDLPCPGHEVGRSKLHATGRRLTHYSKAPSPNRENRTTAALH